MPFFRDLFQVFSTARASRLAGLWLAALTCGLLTPGNSLHASTLSWSAGSSLPTPCANLSAVMDKSGGRIYLLGGRCPAHPLNGFSALSAAPRIWTSLAVPLDTTRVAAGAALDPSRPGSQLVYGGDEPGNGSLNSAGSGALTNPDSSFDAVNSMARARSYLGFATDGVNAYAIGGRDDRGNLLASVEYFNAQGHWQSAVSLPTARWAFPAVDDGAGHIFVFGGGTSTAAASNSALKYTVSSNTWTSVASMPVAVRESAAALGPDGNIYVVGGFNGSATVATVQIYRPATNQWTTGVSLPAALRGAAAVVDAGGHLLIAGGTDAQGRLLASVWSTQALNQPDTAPVFKSSPPLAARVLTAYSYPVVVSGNPQAVVSLVSGPAGLTFNSTTATVSWTPKVTQAGVQKVVLRAVNRAGSATQSFSITVQGPPPTAPAALTKVTVNDVSATLKWQGSTVASGGPVYYRLSQTICRSGRGGGCTTVVYADHITGTSVVVNGLQPGHSYTPTIYAIANGYAIAGPSLTFATPQVPVPQSFTVSGITSNSAILKWTLPAGASVSGFEISNYRNGVAVQIVKVLNLRTYTIKGLTPKTIYSISVRSIDAWGYLSTGTPLVTYRTQ